MATVSERDFSKQLPLGVDIKAQIVVKRLSVKVVRKSKTSAGFIYSLNRRLDFPHMANDSP